MADDGPQNPQVPKDKGVLKSAPIFAKVIQVVLAVFAVGLIVDPFNSFQRIFNRHRTKLDDIAIIYIAVAGYIIINTLFIIGHLLGDRVPKKTSILFSAVGAFLHVVAGSVIVHNWRKLHGGQIYLENNAIHPSKQYMDMLISASVFTFLDAVIFIVDIFLTYRFT